MMTMEKLMDIQGQALILGPTIEERERREEEKKKGKIEG